MLSKVSLKIKANYLHYKKEHGHFHISHQVAETCSMAAFAGRLFQYSESLNLYLSEKEQWLTITI